MCVLLLTLLLPMVNAAAAGDDPGDLALARRYAPVFYFHPDEVFRPQPVDVIVEQARLRHSRRLWFDANVLLSLSVPDLLTVDSDTAHFLDVWYGDSGSSAYTNYSAHRFYYQAVLSTQAGGPSPAVYARVTRDAASQTITIQYWAFYFYNDWFNKHEGDWEMVQVILDWAGEPQWVVHSQHHGGTRRAWSQAPIEEQTHPVAYVALGSHANYFVGNERYPNGKDVGNTRIEIMDRTGSAGRLIPDVILISDRDTVAQQPEDWPGAEWLPFRGHWGELALQGDFGGPLGPADKGQQWSAPYDWGMDQPLDTQAWYQNRLRVEVVGAEPGEAQVRVAARDGSSLAVEELGSLALLHQDPPAAGIEAQVRVFGGTHWDVRATWPDAGLEQVSSVYFEDVPFGQTGRAMLTLGPAGEARLAVDGGPQALTPGQRETVEATWDAADLVWIGGILPAHQVVTGIVLATVMAVVPAAVYVGVLYWLDRYEKEPQHLLAAAFLWGALPAVLMALVVELFFNLPPDLLGPQALEAVRLGLVAPLLQEALKGAAVLFIAWRYRGEFDNVLDGLIYGAMVGFGFAMTGNLASTVGSFLVWGFEGLGAMQLIEGVLYGLDHALYAAIFGVGLGLARLAPRPWQRWPFSLGGFALAALVHALHNLLAYNVLGLSTAAVVTTVCGVGLIGWVAAWSLARQRHHLRQELRGELPPDVYRAVVTPRGRARAQWRALRGQGLRAWRRTRRLHHLCAELAFKRAQARLHPDLAASTAEADRLQDEIQALLNTF